MTTITEFREDPKPLLRPNQVEVLEEEKRQVDAMLGAPDFVSNQIQDRRAMYQRLRAISTQLKQEAPRPYPTEDRDKVVAREKLLREGFVHGMPTQEEMRKAPAGAVDHHRAWLAENKKEIPEWKAIRLRMQATGMLEGPVDAQDAANYERYRPQTSSASVPMHNALIPGTTYSMPRNIEIRNVMSDEDKARLAKQDEQIAELTKQVASLQAPKRGRPPKTSVDKRLAHQIP